MSGTVGAAAASWAEVELSVSVLEKGNGLSSWDSFYNLLFDLDAAADAHAKAVSPDAFGRVSISNPPLSWTESVLTRAYGDYASAVHGGLLHYDWSDLLAD